jgi:hypothetical protein
MATLERTNLNHWITPVGFTKVHKHLDQANSAGNNKKIYNENVIKLAHAWSSSLDVYSAHAI